MKNKIFAIILTVLLSLPISISAVNADLNEPIEISQTVETEAESVLEKELAEVSDAVKDDSYKQPISIRKIAKKFGFAMMGVAISSFLIFFSLSVYNRVRETVIGRVKTPEGETSLSTPENLTDAIKVFLEKTRW